MDIIATSFERESRNLLYRDVIEALYKIIDEEQISPGSQFPPERELIKKLGVSRNVLREAFHVLELRGLVVSRQGKGRFLRALPEKLKFDTKYPKISKNLERHSLLEAYEVRQALENKAMELIVENATDQDLEEIEDTYQTMIKRFSMSGITSGEFEMHRIYAQKSGSRFMERTLEIVLSAILDMMHSSFTGILANHKAEEEASEHKAIIEALKNRDAGLARQRMHKHLQESIDLLKKDTP